MMATLPRDAINVTVRPKQSVSVNVNPKQSVMVNQSGVIAVRKLSDLVDVDVSMKEDGSVLIYDEEQEKFVASRLLEKQNINGGHF
jgi:hypothetical protein